MKKLIIISLALLALLTSCNLDNQGIFAEVIDRTPSDNRKLSVIGLSSDNKTLYFSSVKGIEAYDLVNNTYNTLDDSENARKISISLMVGGKIVYGVTRATQDIVEYTGFYLCDPDGTNKKLNCDNEVIFNGSFENFAYDAEGNIYKAELDPDNLKLTFSKIPVPEEGLSFYSSMDRIFCFKKGSTFTYYLFDETEGLKEISGLDGAGIIRSVAKDSDENYYAVFSASNSKVYKIEGNAATLKGSVVGSKISRNFSSFVNGDYLCYAFDGQSSFYTFNLEDETLSSTTVSKISKVAIVGYYSVDNNGTYRVCTSNNGFFTLKIDSDGKVSIN